MSVEIIATAADPDANSYVDLTDADEWYAHSLRGTIWFQHAESQRTLALVEATRQIDALRLVGEPSTSDQARHFPRTTDDDEIPDAIVAATCLQALHLLQQTATPELLDRTQLQAQGVQTIAMDGMSETYTRAGAEARFVVEAWDYLHPYVVRTGRIPTRGGR